VTDSEPLFVGIDYSLDTTGKVVTITYNGNLNENGTYSAANDTVRLDIAKPNLKDIYGNTMATPATPLQVAWNANYDYVAPTLKDVTLKADTGAGHDIIEVIFNEPVASTNVGDAGLDTDLRVIVQAATPYALAVDKYAATIVGGVVEIALDASVDVEAKFTVELIDGRNLTDVSTNNKPGAFAATSVMNAGDTAVATIDTVVPTAVAYDATDAPTSFKVVSATSITVVFSEKLDATKFVAANANGFAVAGGTAALTSAALGADGVTVTLTGTDFVAGTTTVAYTAGTLTDVAGNALATFGATATN
jgi:hypothetical protein